MLKYALVYKQTPVEEIPSQLYKTPGLAYAANKRLAFPLKLDKHELRTYEIKCINVSPCPVST